MIFTADNSVERWQTGIFVVCSLYTMVKNYHPRLADKSVASVTGLAKTADQAFQSKFVA